MTNETPLAILGGTFDPIHNGHLRFAEEVATVLAIGEVRLVPAGQPPHRSPPIVSAEHRLGMTHLATSGNFSLFISQCCWPFYWANPGRLFYLAGL